MTLLIKIQSLIEVSIMLLLGSQVLSKSSRESFRQPSTVRSEASGVRDPKNRLLTIQVLSNKINTDEKRPAIKNEIISTNLYKEGKLVLTIN